MSVSQFGQDIEVINFYKRKKNGYFVDIGAYDGKYISNTYLLEKEYNWKGICIEPNFRYFSKCNNIRSSINLNLAVYTKDNDIIEMYDDSNGGCSAIIETNNHKFIEHENIIKVPTKRLTTILDEINAPRFIEFLSIDTEGSEYNIMECHDFDKYKFGYICVEHNHIEYNRKKINDLLISKGYILYKQINVDDHYIHNSLINKKLTGIFYNSKKSNCSIHCTGLMIYNILKDTSLYDLEYSEETEIYNQYDFIIYNQHLHVNNWITEELSKEYNKPIFCIVTEIGHRGDIMPFTPRYFTKYIVIDPTITEEQNIYSFPRPIINQINSKELLNKTVPVIGSFGFATYGKLWTYLITFVNNEFEKAIIKINIPYATYVDDNITTQTINDIIEYSNILKPGILLEITSDYMDDIELIKWCSKNTINCFFYSRTDTLYTGLAAVTDQAIASGRPLIVTDDPTFRHIHRYIKSYPEITIKDAINETKEGIKKMREDWSPENFRKKFYSILFDK
jgi:FkbM family methyltransferase